MAILIFIIGLIMGLILNIVVESISYSITKDKRETVNYFILIICGISFEILFLQLGFNLVFAKAVTLTAILIIISFIDLRYRVIPDFLVVITFVIGIIFSIMVKSSPVDIILGAIFGGGILFLFGLIPNAIGGGDIKIMFALGTFLGFNRTLWALLLAFVLSSIVSIILILLKIKGTKDYIPLGPFLALGSFISLLIFI